MGKSGLTIEQVFEEVGWTAKWEVKGEERKALEVAKNLLDIGLPVETIASATRLEVEKVKTLSREGNR